MESIDRIFQLRLTNRQVEIDRFSIISHNLTPTSDTCGLTSLVCTAAPRRASVCQEEAGAGVETGWWTTRPPGARTRTGGSTPRTSPPATTLTPASLTMFAGEGGPGGVSCPPVDPGIGWVASIKLSFSLPSYNKASRYVCFGIICNQLRMKSEEYYLKVMCLPNCKI